MELVEKFIKKFRININQIIRNTDNTEQDIKNESFIVLYSFYDNIIENEKVFLNELRKRCLKFNKYGRAITSKERWEKFNNYEVKLQDEYDNPLNIDEDKIVSLEAIKDCITNEEYDFLIYYYGHGQDETSLKYGLKNGATRKRVSTLIKKIKKELNE